MDWLLATGSFLGWSCKLNKYELWRMEEATNRILHFWWPGAVALVALCNLQWLVGRLPFLASVRGCCIILGAAVAGWQHRRFLVSRPIRPTKCIAFQICMFCAGCALSIRGAFRVDDPRGTLGLTKGFFLTTSVPLLYCFAALAYLPTRIFRSIVCPIYLVSWMFFHTQFGLCDVAVQCGGISLVILAAMVQELVDSSKRKLFDTSRRLEDEQRFLDATQSCLSALLSSQFLATCVCNLEGQILCSTPQFDTLIKRKSSSDGDIHLRTYVTCSETACQLKQFLHDVLSSKTSHPQTFQVVLTVNGRGIGVTLYAVVLPSRTSDEGKQGILLGLQENRGPSLQCLQRHRSDPGTEVIVETSGNVSSDRAPANQNSVDTGGLRSEVLSGRPSGKAATRPVGLQGRLGLKLHIDCSSAKQVLHPNVLERGYTSMTKIGFGSSGRVYSANRRADGKLVALKTTDYLDHWESIEKEFKILQSVVHPNIIRAFDLFKSGSDAVMVLEYFDGVTLDTAVKQVPRKSFPEGMACLLTKALLQAVDYLHGRRIIHRDIKPDNIMLSHELNDLRLLDFNAAKCLSEGGALTMTGTNLFAGPEVLRGEPPAEPNDVWGCGICLHIMLFGTMPWHAHASPDGLADYIDAHPLQFDTQQQPISDPCRAVLRQCLMVDKRFRPAPITLLMYQWFWCHQVEPVTPQLARRRSPKMGRTKSI